MTAANHQQTLQRHAHHALAVRDIVQETDDTRTFVMDVPTELDELYRYDAGQFCTVRAVIGGEEVSRCYSMSSAPAFDEPLALTAKRVPGGIMSNWLHDHVQVGDVLELMPPAGRFCERPGHRPILAFCGGSGVTPIFSIVKQVLAQSSRPIRLFDANRDEGAIIFREALDGLAASHPGRLDVHHHLDAASGFPTAGTITDFVGTDVDADVFVCGPTPFMDLVEAGLEHAGVPAGNVTIERFVDAARPAGGDGPPGHADGARTTAGSTTTLTITIKRKQRVIEHVAGDTVLEAARRAGLKPPFSCEQGNCASCMALVTDGEVSMRANNALTPDEVEEGWVLTCQALPVTSTVAIEYDDL